MLQWGGYYAFNGNDNNEVDKKATLIAEEAKTSLTEDKLATEFDGTNITENEEASNEKTENSNVEPATEIEIPPKGVTLRGYQVKIEDTVQFTNISHFYQNDEQVIDETKNPTSSQDFYSISIEGNICYGSLFNLNLNTNKQVEWYINDESPASRASSIPYQFFKGIEYRIEAYVGNKKVADTFIDMRAPNVVIDQQELGSDAARLTAKTSEIKTAEWVYDGKVLSLNRQFAFDKRLYKTSPYLVTTDKHGCKDTFRVEEKEVEPHFNFVQTVFTPNGDG